MTTATAYPPPLSTAPTVDTMERLLQGLLQIDARAPQRDAVPAARPVVPVPDAAPSPPVLVLDPVEEQPLEPATRPARAARAVRAVALTPVPVPLSWSAGRQQSRPTPSPGRLAALATAATALAMIAAQGDFLP